MSHPRQNVFTLILLISLLAVPFTIHADQVPAPIKSVATYLGNEAVMVEHGDTKVLFDPFFHNAFGYYQLVPETIRSALFEGLPPYDNIDAIFISHAHADHFSAADIETFLQSFPAVSLVAPAQAIDQLMTAANLDETKLNIIAIDLEYRDAPISHELGKLKFDAVRIPHAGWPQRADISNLVYRVTLGGELTVVHMGDADTNDAHYQPLMAYWQKQAVNTAFPPYWFFLSKSGQLVLSDRIAAATNIGIHVPVEVPGDLKQTGARFFSTPEQQYDFRLSEMVND